MENTWPMKLTFTLFHLLLLQSSKGSWAFLVKRYSNITVFITQGIFTKAYMT